jgi:hypothetical protein
MNLLLIKNEIIHHAEKNMNKRAGFLFGRLYFITGNKSITNDALSQFAITA